MTTTEDLLSSVPDVGCFGCSPTNPVGLRLKFHHRGDTVYVRDRIPDRFHGAPGIAHGGIVATILDEISCVAGLVFRGRYVVTGELTVRYLRPCPVDVELEFLARIADSDAAHPRYVVIEGEVRQGDETLVRSTGRFFPQEREEYAP
jgi:acyl-coenzyme A thioesterase PaaI-like protein